MNEFAITRGKIIITRMNKGIFLVTELGCWESFEHKVL
jgi:hypothetical protein